MLDITLQGKRKRKNLVIFIHGLTGDASTWINNNGKSFADLLNENKEIRKRFDIGHFIYFTKFYTPRTVNKIANFFRNLINNQAAHVEINLDIEDITDVLQTELELKANSYEEIVLIGHSLGGLISKSLIIRKVHNPNVRVPKIKKFISLAVPHNGSSLATIASTLLGNAHIKDIATLSEAVNRLNNSWLQTPIELLPNTAYFHGKYDDVVKDTSSIGYETQRQTVLSFEADHTTIAKPTSIKDSIYIAVEEILLSVVSEQEIADALSVKRLKDEDLFNDEYFVLKLLIADVHQKTIKSAKNCFYNAEFVRKVVISKKIMSAQEFESLYNLIEGLYNTGFALLTAGEITDGNALVAYVHNRIEEEDQHKLKTIASITFVHKTGMLHQLANTLDRDIWWKDGLGVEDIEEMKNKFPEA